MSGGLDLEQRYRRVLRLLPGYYRDNSSRGPPRARWRRNRLRTRS
jgi:hypothetical protein